MKFNRLIKLVEALNLTYPIGFSDNLFPLSSTYSKELTTIKNKVSKIAEQFKFEYVGRADRSFEYQRSSDELGFRIGISGVNDDMMSIVLFGSSQSHAFVRGDGKTVAFTPRGYANKPGAV